MSQTEKLEILLQEAGSAVQSAVDQYSLDQVRSKYLGKSSPITESFKLLSSLPANERPLFGQKINQIKITIENLLLQRQKELQDSLVLKELDREPVDVTLPSNGQCLGSLHPVTKIRMEVEDFFLRMGFIIAEGPEVESDYYNFTALNFPPQHPARHMHDTFYFEDGSLLRTHTSPVQIRMMEAGKPPFRIIAPGKVYRCDSDATHSPMFHQVEGLVVDENISFADLKGLLVRFVKEFFGDLPFRFRASYFPFTEPSAELDIAWKMQDGTERWLELGGCGMVHPNVFKAVNVDGEKYSGFAFGMGLDRLAMLKYAIDDLRVLFTNDLQFLEQF